MKLEEYTLIEIIRATLIAIGLEKEYKDDIDDIARGVIDELHHNEFKKAGNTIKVPKLNN